MKTLYVSVVVALVFLTAGYFYFEKTTSVSTSKPKDILNFLDCVNSGYIVLESYPRQCRTPDGRVFAEEVVSQPVYTNASEDNIKIDLPTPGAVVGKQFSVIGKARGSWYFEASFPVQVLDKDGKILFQGPAQAQGEWMTEDFVDFKLDISISENYIGKGTLVLKKDNPSGDVTKDASVTIPINIEY